ncbi:MAG: phosphate acyltransferase PlsX [Verrucomicrobiota bacterium]
MKIALDAMGGDYAPERPVAAAIEALEMYPHIEKIFLVGDESRIRVEMAKFPDTLKTKLNVLHCTEVIGMDEHAVSGVRRKKDNSINRSIQLVRDGEADAVVSAGHTGAVVAGSSIFLRTLPGVFRPGIATTMPTETNVFVLTDAGANVDARAEHLAQYGIMGSIYSEKVLKYSKPRVGLLSVGTEDAKGNDLTKEAFKLLQEAPINFVGNVEGHDLYERPVEVVVTDGFTGNVVLKTSESIANAIFRWLKRELKSTPFRMFGAWLSRNAFYNIKKKTNYEEYGGSLLLGVNGICVIAHGSSTVKAIRNAVRVGAEAVELQINEQIIEAVAQLKQATKKGFTLSWKN